MKVQRKTISYRKVVRNYVQYVWMRNFLTASDMLVVSREEGRYYWELQKYIEKYFKYHKVLKRFIVNKETLKTLSKKTGVSHRQVCRKCQKALLKIIQYLEAVEKILDRKYHFEEFSIKHNNDKQKLIEVTQREE